VFEPLEDLALSPGRLSLALMPAAKISGPNLRELNLEEELYTSYSEAKAFYESIKTDSSIPPNQVAQVMNTLNTILKEIIKLQTELYNAGRLKNLEYCMITAIKEAPGDVQAVFFENYERLLGK